MPDPNPVASKADTRRFPRLAPRRATHAEAFRDPTGKGADLAVRLLDLSAVGAKLLLKERLAVGHVLALALYGPGASPIATTARVIWTTEGDAGGFVTGVEFAHQVGEENVGSLGQP